MRNANQIELSSCKMLNMIIIECLKMCFRFRKKISRKITTLIKHLIEPNLHKKISFSSKKGFNRILHLTSLRMTKVCTCNLGDLLVQRQALEIDCRKGTICQIIRLKCLVLLELKMKLLIIKMVQKAE